VLLRADERGVLAIGQASHAWISGQLARAWGSAAFGAITPAEEVCLAAEQHDIGMAKWDREPSFNPETGLPHGFTEMPLEVHLALWRAGPRRLVCQSRHAALLASLHGARLYARRDLTAMAAEEADAVREFLADQHALQAELRASLAADPGAAEGVAPERLQRNSDLVWTWDGMSLALCLGWAPWRAERVPLAGGGATDVEIAPGGAPDRVLVDPWPFRQPALAVHCEGRRLRAGGYPNENALRSGLAAAPWETLTVELAPARSA
jgi:hypothetical protein